MVINNIADGFKYLMIQEGGAEITATSGDKGGLTKYGIAQASHPGVDIAALTEQQAQDIYAKEYWNPAACDKLPDTLKYAHFSCAVNCGVRTAAKILQNAAKVKPDGCIGPATLGAANSLSLEDYCIEWASYYRRVVENDMSQQRFLKGWLNRIDFVLKLSKQQ